MSGVQTGYPDRPVITGLDLTIPAGQVTCLIGPNGSGKSTLVKTMCDLLRYEGSLTFEGRELHSWGRRERARKLALLPQTPVAPPGLTVRQLLARGRHPYQSWLAQWSTADDKITAQVMETTGLGGVADRRIGDLSGGQRQRVWIAMTMVQNTATMLLDEPTTYLDLATSVDVLRLVRAQCDEAGRSIVMVLHDINLAARFADHLVVMRRGGDLAATGAPAEVITEELLMDVFGLDAVVAADPVTGGPLVVPR
ncbi:cobalamin/Fe(3+)-siderophore ABC transporter ATP-binding protein [Corynebacterium yudongzhengii]|uniref:ABC transporter ATP-binding protein n=2 Tax=Corynebacterium yudongzhengii TaxID=2080740 RepID=A0A2U1TA59_9CORY|nr:cobalamin/Fe(3+)-siderophore ABC transporter ATP-binding protein [Corynebacterium yudongzhengii]PWC02788.1 ABC transporter ATP-binding protein [Corynebacterium yudongzhengii]